MKNFKLATRPHGTPCRTPLLNRVTAASALGAMSASKCTTNSILIIYLLCEAINTHIKSLDTTLPLLLSTRIPIEFYQEQKHHFTTKLEILISNSPRHQCVLTLNTLWTAAMSTIAHIRTCARTRVTSPAVTTSAAPTRQGQAGHMERSGVMRANSPSPGENRIT